MNTSSPAIPVLPEQKLQVNNISRTQVEGDGGICSTKLKNETVSKKAFALQDKVTIFFWGKNNKKKLLTLSNFADVRMWSRHFSFQFEFIDMF